MCTCWPSRSLGGERPTICSNRSESPRPRHSKPALVVPSRGKLLFDRPAGLVVQQRGEDCGIAAALLRQQRIVGGTHAGVRDDDAIHAADDLPLPLSAVPQESRPQSILESLVLPILVGDVVADQDGHVVVAKETGGREAVEQFEALLDASAPVHHVSGEDKPVACGIKAAVLERVLNDLRIPVDIGDDERARHLLSLYKGIDGTGD